MKPLLKPAGRPHRDLLKQALGISGVSTVSNSKEYEVSLERILGELKTLTAASSVSLEARQDQGNASLRTYVLSVADGNTGSIQLSYGGRDNFTIKATLFWSFLPDSIDKLVAGVDGLWSGMKWRVLYAYDCDDFTLQNCTMALGLQNWGLVREQLDFVNRYGIVEEIDTRANPGFMLNEDSLFWTIQWLNYWSKEAQDRMLASPLPRLPIGVTMHDMGDGAIRFRLGEKPGYLDDVAFHELQLECRRSLPFRPPFGITAH